MTISTGEIDDLVTFILGQENAKTALEIAHFLHMERSTAYHWIKRIDAAGYDLHWKKAPKQPRVYWVK